MLNMSTVPSTVHLDEYNIPTGDWLSVVVLQHHQLLLARLPHLITVLLQRLVHLGHIARRRVVTRFERRP